MIIKFYRKAAWNRDGEGQFHHNCWRDLVRAASPRGEGLSSVEVKMIQEAVKTAELHDADALIASEAKRIRQILRTSIYPIFFTGKILAKTKQKRNKKVTVDHAVPEVGCIAILDDI